MLLPDNNFSAFKMLLFDLKKKTSDANLISQLLQSLLQNFATYIECHINIFSNHLSDVNVNCI